MIGFYNYTVYATYAGFISAVCGLYLALTGHPTFGIICLLVSGLCDMFDGKIARTRERTKAEQQFGIQIDSLSDLVCFGVLPAVIGYVMGMRRWFFVPILALYMLCALIRLAYFNVTEEERQTIETGTRRFYEGLPVTSSALIFPLIYLLRFFVEPKWFTIIYAAALLIVAVAFISPFKLRKPGMKMLLVFLACGLIELAILLVLRYVL
ncbi:MAG: CDP-alcohol phosphatidyltransferase family protein [Clostridia bacterium]|nr:CDP-alcohol phosphatidyltransferase family protein [Clostridia bacterium]